MACLVCTEHAHGSMTCNTAFLFSAGCQAVGAQGPGGVDTARAHQRLVRVDASDRLWVRPGHRGHPPGRPRKGAPNDQNITLGSVLAIGAIHTAHRAVRRKARRTTQSSCFLCWT